MTREELLKTAKPILFSTEMVKAILEGRKSVTRRVIKPKYKEDEGGFSVCTNKSTGERWVEKHDWDEGSFDNPRYVHPLYQVGDIIYVRETHCPNYFDEFVSNKLKCAYKADWNPELIDGLVPEPKWKPSIHMKKELARIFLNVTDVRVERLQDITEEQAIKEGLISTVKGNLQGDDYKGLYAREHFIEIIQNIYPDIKMDSWLWVIEFERVIE